MSRLFTFNVACLREDDTLIIEEDLQELMDGKFNSIKTMQLEDPSRTLVLPGLDSNEEMSLFTIANPKGSKLGHETGCNVYKTLDWGDLYKNAGMIVLSIQIERPCDRSRDVVHAAGDNPIYIDAMLYLLMPFGDHPPEPRTLAPRLLGSYAPRLLGPRLLGS